MDEDRIINECHTEIRRLRQVVRDLQDDLKKFKEPAPEEKARHFLDLLFNMLPHQPRSSVKDDPGFWTDGESILCPSETEREIIADFLEDVLRECSAATISTGSYDEKEDRRAGTEDNHTGFHYVSVG